MTATVLNRLPHYTVRRSKRHGRSLQREVLPFQPQHLCVRLRYQRGRPDLLCALMFLMSHGPARRHCREHRDAVRARLLPCVARNSVVAAADDPASVPGQRVPVQEQFPLCRIRRSRRQLCILRRQVLLGRVQLQLCLRHHLLLCVPTPTSCGLQ